MEALKNENSDCNCNGNCCQPPKRKTWKKLLFFVILFLAIVIVSVKLIGKSDAETQITTGTTEAQQPACCDTTVNKGSGKIADTNKSCCPKPKE